MECCNLQYIGKNPIDLRTDEVTTVNQEQKIVVKDVAINGNVKDLVKDRGIFNSKSLTGTDYNTLTKQGVYSIPNTGSTNGPGYTAKLLVYSVAESPFVTQVAIDTGSVAIKCRYKSDTADWTPWETIIFNTDTATTTKAGIVRLNNTVTSTSISQAATANAVKIAYDKAVEASESTGRSETADKLTTARTIQTNLASTAAGSFDGSKNITVGVSGVLPVANGGTGNSNGMMTVNLPKNQTRYHLLSAKSSIATHPVIEICEPFADAPEVGGGKNVSFGSDGATILASGESGSGLMEELKSAATEQLYLISDSGITMYVGANTYKDKKAITISNAGAITTPGIVKAAGFTGNASSASKLATARTIGIGGVVTGTATAFDGSKNITIDTTTLNLEDAGVTGELPTSHGGTGRTDGKAVGLVTKRTIDGVYFDGTANITHFGSCSTAAATAAKVVSVPNFVLAAGAEVTVRFTVTNTAASPTLNVNNTGAKAIVYRNAAISAGYLAANRVYKFVYDGTNYELIGDIDTNTRYTAASATPKAPGTAAVGTSAKYAREDHVHPLQTTVSGNAGSATKLATARTIGITGVVTGTATSFDGTKNISIDATKLNIEDTGITGELPIAHGGTGRTDGKSAALVTARTISLTGAVTGSTTFDGSKNVSISTQIGSISGTVPIGGIIAFSGTFGGTGNRYPIPLGSTTPDTHWCLCDGITTNSLTVPDLRGKMILGSSTEHAVGETGGSETHTHSVSGTVGAHTLTVAQTPAHNHTFTSSKGDKDYNNGGSNTWWGWNSDRTTTTTTVGSTQSHTHNFSKTSTTTETLLPPYYALSYIMRIS